MSGKAKTVPKKKPIADPEVRDEREKNAWLNFLLEQGKKEINQLKEANDRLAKSLKFSELQLTAKEQDIKDLQGELARRFLTTKESLLDKIEVLQSEVASLERKLKTKSEEAEQLQREGEKARVATERQVGDKERVIESLLALNEQTVHEIQAKILPKLNAVHQVESAQGTSQKQQLEGWLQSFRRDMLLMQ